MAASGDLQNNTDNLTVTDKLNNFIQKNRKKLFIGLASAIAILAVLIIGISVRDKLQENALSQADGFNKRYEELKAFINSDDIDAIQKQADIAILLVDLESFAGKKSGYPAAWAYSISADIFGDQKKWDDAEKSYINAAKAAGKSYLAPVSFFNAAVAAEEQGNIDTAIEYYNKALDFGNAFAAAARAQFAIGRLEESRDNKTAALIAYNTLLAKWPGDPVWTNLAQSRIIVISD